VLDVVQALKAKVALAALKALKTVPELTRDYIPTRINAWKPRLGEGIPSLSGRAGR